MIIMFGLMFIVGVGHLSLSNGFEARLAL